MQRPLRTLLCLLPLALAACETSVPPEQASSAPPPPPAAAPVLPAEVAAAPPPVTAAAEAPAPVTAAGAVPTSDGSLPEGIAREVQPMKTIGVVACDSYVEAVRACLNDGHIVGGARVKVRSALAKQLKAWEGRQPDIDACVAARGEARTQLKQYGCVNI